METVIGGQVLVAHGELLEQGPWKSGRRKRVVQVTRGSCTHHSGGKTPLSCKWRDTVLSLKQHEKPQAHVLICHFQPLKQLPIRVESANLPDAHIVSLCLSFRPNVLVTKDNLPPKLGLRNLLYPAVRFSKPGKESLSLLLTSTLNWFPWMRVLEERVTFVAYVVQILINTDRHELELD